VLGQHDSRCFPGRAAELTRPPNFLDNVVNLHFYEHLFPLSISLQLVKLAPVPLLSGFETMVEIDLSLIHGGRLDRYFLGTPDQFLMFHVFPPFPHPLMPFFIYWRSY